MSFGKSNQSSNQQMDPQIKGALMNVFNTGTALSRTPYNPYNFARVAPMSPFQQQGMQATLDASRGGIGRDQIRQAIASAMGVSAYQPNNVTAGQVNPVNRVGDINPGMAGGQQQVRSSNVPTSFQGRNATVGNINTGVNAPNVRAGNTGQNFTNRNVNVGNVNTAINAGDVAARAANEQFRQSNINVGGVDTGIQFNDVAGAQINNPGRISEQQQRGQAIGPLDLLGPGASARDAQQISAPSSINVGRVNAGDVRSVGPVGVGAINPGNSCSKQYW